ncbi:MAG: hypothetical protein GXP38_05010 [Chloroflexi bacterium]|nr:hypothetical protein [Chloroflexota bacterium]
MSYLTTQLIQRIAQRLHFRNEHPEDASRHFNLSTLEYIALTETDVFSEAVEAARLEFIEHIETIIGVKAEGVTPKEKYQHAKKLSKDLSKILRYPDRWGV